MNVNQNQKESYPINAVFYSETQYRFFCHARLQNLAGQFGASIAIVSLTWNIAHQPTLVAYLIINQILVLLTGIAFYSQWTNRRLTFDGLPRFTVGLGVIRQTFLGSLFWLNLEATHNLTFVLAVLLVLCGCLLGSIVTLGPLKRLAMPSMTCLLLPSALACLFVGHYVIGIAVLFFIYIVALRGVKQVNLVYEELVRLREESSLTAKMFELSNSKLTFAFKTLEEEMDRRALIEDERKKLQEELLEASRQAGKAEIATGVLHNVGNVMNSVNISTGMMKNELRDRLLKRLDASILLLGEHEEDLAGFFANEKRAEHFLPFLKQLSGQTADMVDEFDKLLLNIKHVNDVVADQQSFAMRSQFAVSEDPAVIVASAINITDERYKQLQIELKSEISCSGMLSIDKSKLLQVLVNLLNNAADSIFESERDEKCVTLRIDRIEDQLCIEIEDTGIGIPVENINRIFHHGFSTRTDRGGHGFGLHHSANAIKEMGGELFVESPGTMQGATFKIQLPWNDSAVELKEQSFDSMVSV